MQKAPEAYYIDCGDSDHHGLKEAITFAFTLALKNAVRLLIVLNDLSMLDHGTFSSFYRDETRRAWANGDDVTLFGVRVFVTTVQKMEKSPLSFKGVVLGVHMNRESAAKIDRVDGSDALVLVPSVKNELNLWASEREAVEIRSGVKSIAPPPPAPGPLTKDQVRALTLRFVYPPLRRQPATGL